MIFVDIRNELYYYFHILSTESTQIEKEKRDRENQKLRIEKRILSIDEEQKKLFLFLTISIIFLILSIVVVFFLWNKDYVLIKTLLVIIFIISLIMIWKNLALKKENDKRRKIFELKQEELNDAVVKVNDQYEKIQNVMEKLSGYMSTTHNDLEEEVLELPMRLDKEDFRNTIFYSELPISLILISIYTKDIFYLMELTNKITFQEDYLIDEDFDLEKCKRDLEKLEKKLSTFCNKKKKKRSITS